jgi:hypothetical protein
MRGNTRFMLAVVLSLILSSCARVQKGTTGEVHYVSVPEDYRALYHELATELGNLSKRIRYKGNGRKGETAFGVELLVANSNRGEILLTDRVFQATTLTLDRLKDLGTHSVALSIQYPTLTRSYPRSSEYTDFYKRVAREIRRRGYILIIEMGTTFREPEFSKMRVDYSGLTMKRFNAQLRDMAETIIKDLRPDHLTILSEPDTQARNTGLDFSVSNFATTIRYVAQGLQHPGVRLGAGAGTWNQMAYFTALAGIPQLDYIDLHIYPVQRDFVVDRAIKVANTARKHKKAVSIGEAWLYKVSERELGSISPVKAFARDVYSFWQPLDSLFVEIIFDLAHHLDAEFCSFFWMKYMYGYVNYDANTKTLRPQDLIKKADSVAGRHILNGTLSATGERFRTLVTSGQ